jgi:hypothetical protein
LAGVRGLRITFAVDSRPATFAEVITAWQGDAAFRSQFNALLAGSLYRAFRWETPAVTAATAGAGVPWLHARLDDRPKDFGFAPYREHSRPSAGMSRAAAGRKVDVQAHPRAAVASPGQGAWAHPSSLRRLVNNAFLPESRRP